MVTLDSNVSDTLIEYIECQWHPGRHGSFIVCSPGPSFRSCTSDLENIRLYVKESPYCVSVPAVPSFGLSVVRTPSASLYGTYNDRRPRCRFPLALRDTHGACVGCSFLRQLDLSNYKKQRTSRAYIGHSACVKRRALFLRKPENMFKSLCLFARITRSLPSRIVL
jgi:hypothetical protein